MNQSDLARNACMLHGSRAKRGYLRWWHSFCGYSSETGVTRTFFIEFFLVNPGLGGSTPLLGQFPHNKKNGIRPSYVMVKAGAFPGSDGSPGVQLHHFYPMDALQASGNPLIMQVGDCLYSEDRLHGSLEVTPSEAAQRFFLSDSGALEWDVEVHKAVSCHTGFLAGPLFQALHALDSFWHGEGIRSFFKGHVTLDGVAYQVDADSSYGYADKHWGRAFNRPWLQLASCRLTSEHSGQELRHSVLALDGCCPRLLWFPLRRRLAIQLTYTGEDFTFGLPGTLLSSRLKWEKKETGKRLIWRIVARNRKAMVKISCSCTREQMFALNYENPEGVKSRRPILAGGAGNGTIQLYRRVPGAWALMDTLHMENTLCIYQRENALGKHGSGQVSVPGIGK